MNWVKNQEQEQIVKMVQKFYYYQNLFKIKQLHDNERY